LGWVAVLGVSQDDEEVHRNSAMLVCCACGGGKEISFMSLIAAMLEDFPNNREL
jgi:hypothetical protein